MRSLDGGWCLDGGCCGSGKVSYQTTLPDIFRHKTKPVDLDGNSDRYILIPTVRRFCTCGSAYSVPCPTSPSLALSFRHLLDVAFALYSTSLRLKFERSRFIQRFFAFIKLDNSTELDSHNCQRSTIQHNYRRPPNQASWEPADLPL